MQTRNILLAWDDAAGALPCGGAQRMPDVEGELLQAELRVEGLFLLGCSGFAVVLQASPAVRREPG